MNNPMLNQRDKNERSLQVTDQAGETARHEFVENAIGPNTALPCDDSKYATFRDYNS